MGTDNKELALIIRAEVDRAIKDVRRFRQDAGKQLSELNQVGNTGAAVFGGLGKVMGALGVGLSLAAVVGQVRAAVNEAAEAERIEGRLGAVLKSTGQEWKFSREELERYADALADTTRFTDEEAKAGITSLLTFTNIAKENFGATLTVAADLAAVMETDLKGAIEAVGKVIANPEDGFGRLSRRVQDLTDAQKEQVKQMIATGNAAGAQKFILEQLTARVGGAAAGENTGLYKATNDVNKAWGDMLEAFARVPTVQSATTTSLGAITFALRALEGQAKESRLEFERTMGLSKTAPRALPGSEFGKPLSPTMFADGPKIAKPQFLSDDGRKALEDMDRRIATLGRETAAEQMLYEIEKGRYRLLSAGEKELLLAKAKQVDAAKAQHDRAKEEIADAEEMKKKWEAYEQGLDQAAQRVKDAVDPTREYKREIEQLDQLWARGKITGDEYIASVTRVELAMQKLAQGTQATNDELAKIADETRNRIQDALGDELFNMLNGNFENIGDSFIRLLKRMAAELAASQIMKFLGGAGRGVTAGVLHSGGTVGSAGATRQVSPLAFALAPRMHTGGIAGLRPDEVPIIAQRGETVLPADFQPANARGDVKVVVQNNGTPQTVRDTAVSFDPEGMVVRILTEDLQRGGPVAGAIGRTYNLRRSGG